MDNWEAEMVRMTPGTNLPASLVGSLFSTPKELRHIAEQSLGQLFVPTEVLSAGERTADVVLRPAGMDEIRVHGERERHWYPYVITRVETNGR